MKAFINFVLSLRNSLNKPGDYRYIAQRDFGNEIPKIIHQTYPSKHLPPEIEQNIAQLKALNPNWQVRLYDDLEIEAYIQRHYPEILSLYQSINPIYGAARADFFRYLLIYNEGGVYLDIKSTVTKPLDDIIHPEDRYLLCHWQNDPGEIHQVMGRHACIQNPHGEYQQWHVIAAHGHPFLKAVIENVCNNIRHYNPLFHDTGGWAVVNMTGPIAYTLAIQPILNQYPHRLARDNRTFSLIYSIYELQKKGMGHHKILKKHYTTCTESLIKLNPIMQCLFAITQPCIQFIKQWLITQKQKI